MALGALSRLDISKSCSLRQQHPTPHCSTQRRASAAGCMRFGQRCQQGHKVSAAPTPSTHQLRGAPGRHEIAFVDNLRQASGYVQGHRGTVLVVILPKEVRAPAQILLMALSRLIHAHCHGHSWSKKWSDQVLTCFAGVPLSDHSK